MEYKIIYHDENDFLKQAAQLHYESLSYRSFITSFGENFLYQLYKGILQTHIGFFVCAIQDNQLKGFILGCFDSSKLILVVGKRLYIFFPLIISRIVKNPALMIKLYETLRYTNRSDERIKSELLIIAVKENYRSRGIGTFLLKLLDDEFKKYEIVKYKVIVHKDMHRSNEFYVKNGMKFLKTFHLFNLQWNVYVKNIK